MTLPSSGLLAALAGEPAALRFRRGIEREALRVAPDGNLSKRPHPEHLGSKLAHDCITTDFSESQLELITAVSDDIEGTLETLDQIHRYTVSGMGEELLWSASMPCMLPGDNDIPLAQYGSSNLARLKTTYRNGLGHRYGRAMQTICAVHYNFSLPDAAWTLLAAAESETLTPAWRSRRYFDLMRNFRRLAWLPVYLFGASPAVCNSFVRGREHTLEPFDEGSLYAPFATSLRSGNLGYQSDTQGGLLKVCYNSLDNYVHSLAEAICTPWPEYEAIGLVRGDEHLQVNTNILQSEAEFYTNVRAKCVPPKGTNFLKQLRGQGVEYIEVRLLDVNPYLPLGIDAEQIRFLDMLLLHCLVSESPAHDDALCEAAGNNMQAVVWRGRDPELRLDDAGAQRGVADWGAEIIEALGPVADILDAGAGQAYRASLDAQAEKLADASCTPSGRILADMQNEGIPYFRFAMNKALSHNDHFRSRPLDPDTTARFESMAKTSREAQGEIEAGDDVDFDTYLARFRDEYRELL